MKRLETLLKTGLLFLFSLLNAIDLVQTMHFLRRGIEANLFAVYYPHLWFTVKLALTLGLPFSLHKLDIYLQKEDRGGFHDFLGYLAVLLYLVVLLADILLISIVLRNTSVLGRLVWPLDLAFA